MYGLRVRPDYASEIVEHEMRRCFIEAMFRELYKDFVRLVEVRTCDCGCREIAYVDTATQENIPVVLPRRRKRK